MVIVLAELRRLVLVLLLVETSRTVMLKLIEEILPMPLGFSAVILAQTAGVDSGIIPLIGNGVTVVILAWYVIYDVRYRTPNMLSAFQTEQTETRKTYENEKKVDREAHTALIEAMRTAFITEQAALRQSFTIEQQATRLQADKEAAALRQMLWENMQAMRTAVHDVRDTAQLAVTNREIAKREKGNSDEQR